MLLDGLKKEFLSATELPELRKTMDSFCKQLQSGDSKLWVCFVQMFSSSLERPLMYLHNRFPLKWQENYDNKKYHLVDPSWNHAKYSTVPFFWSDLDRLNPDQNAMVEDAKRHGLRSGVLIPFHGRSGYSLLWVMSSNEEAQCREELEYAKAKAYDILPFIYEAVNKVVFGDKPILTKREIDVIYWVAEGLSTEEVAKRIYISPVTVEKHVANACKKLEAKNRTQCVRMAINLGLLIPRETSFNYSIRSKDGK